jgi:hypothetical protein
LLFWGLSGLSSPSNENLHVIINKDEWKKISGKFYINMGSDSDHGRINYMNMDVLAYKP